jgi:type IV pilus assembly protein PilC
MTYQRKSALRSSQHSQTKESYFVWVGINQQGVKIRGERQAANAQLVRINLRREGITTHSIRKKPKPLFKPKITATEIAQFSRQLTIMLEAGIPIVQALDSIAKGYENPSLSHLVREIKQDIEEGSSLAKAIQQQPKYFDDLFVSLVTAGEYAGTLENMLNELANYQEKIQALKAKVKKSMLYPLFVLSATSIIFSLMLIFVIPQFKQVFSNLNAQLPTFTLLLIDLSDWLQNSWWKLVLSLAASVYVFLWAKRHFRGFQYWLDRVLLKLPLIGKISQFSAIARFSRTLSIMFAAGVPLVEAMDSVAGSTGNQLYKQATLNIKQDISQGLPLFSAMQNQQIFPNMVIQMTKVGEESGRVDEMLARVANYYEDYVDNLTESLVKQIEPLIMLLIGGLVGALVIAMYLPIFKLGEAI